MIILSAYLPLAEMVLSERSEANCTIPIMMAHGKQDNMIPIRYAKKSCEFLLNAGYSVEFHEYVALEHQICAEEIHDVSQWLQSKLLP